MNFTVIWTQETLSELAQIWIDSEDRSAVTRVSHELDRLLREDPLLPRFELAHGLGTVM